MVVDWEMVLEVKVAMSVITMDDRWKVVCICL